MKNTSRAYFIFNLELTFILEAHASEKHRAWCFAVKKNRSSSESKFLKNKRKVPLET